MSEFDNYARLLNDGKPLPPVSDLVRQLRGERLTTMEVLYYMPAHPDLLQRFMWQTLDRVPDFPRIHRFLNFWKEEIDAVIARVDVSAAGLVRPAQINTHKTLSRNELN